MDESLEYSGTLVWQERLYKGFGGAKVNSNGRIVARVTQEWNGWQLEILDNPLLTFGPFQYRWDAYRIAEAWFAPVLNNYGI